MLCTCFLNCSTLPRTSQKGLEVATKISQSQKGPILRTSPDWKRSVALPHLRHYAKWLPRHRVIVKSSRRFVASESVAPWSAAAVTRLAVAWRCPAAGDVEATPWILASVPGPGLLPPQSWIENIFSFNKTIYMPRPMSHGSDLFNMGTVSV